MDHQGALYPGPGVQLQPASTYSVIPFNTKKIPEGPDLPPRKSNMYVTQQTVLAPLNVYESQDTYVCMNPAAAGAMCTAEAPPPEYDACTIPEEEKEEFYDEIPGEHFVSSKGEESSEVQYGNINTSEVKLQLQNAERVE